MHVQGCLAVYPARILKDRRSSLAPCKPKGIHFATFSLDPLFMARRSAVSGLRMTTSRRYSSDLHDRP